jgi:tripartite-type tricarboxylate transporter receptor subunit TctC
MNRIFALLAGAALSLLCLGAQAQAFPNKPVHLISAYPAGIAPDVAARLVAERLSRTWGQPVILEAKPGANGFIAIGAAKKSAPDGYELLVVGNAHLTINPHVFKTLPYDPETDFVPVSLIYRAPFFIVVAANGPYRSIQDIVAAAKADPQKISYSTPYVGSPPHLGGAMLAALTGTQMLAVHFKDGAQMYTSVANGDVSFSVATSGSALPLVSAGKLKFLAIAAPQRLASQPDVATVKEVGGPAGYEVESWVGFVAPRGTPPEVVRRLSADVATALTDPDLKERYRILGIEPVATTSAEMLQLIRTDLKRTGDIVKRANINPE